MAVLSQMPSGNINAVPEIVKLICTVAISIKASSGNINIVLEIPRNIHLHVQWLSQYHWNWKAYTYFHINTVSINSTYMLSDNLNTCAINKYINTLRGNDNRTAATWWISTSSSYLDTVWNQYIYILCPVAILILFQ